MLKQQAKWNFNISFAFIHQIPYKEIMRKGNWKILNVVFFVSFELLQGNKFVQLAMRYVFSWNIEYTIVKQLIATTPLEVISKLMSLQS